MANLTYINKKYPSGTEYYDLFVGKVQIGHATLEGEGFLAQGRRKPVATLYDCAKQLLDSKMNACMKEHAVCQKLLRAVLSDHQL